MKNNLAPVILFVYNRLDHTRQTVEALQKNELAAESTLYVFADGAKEDATDEQREKVQDVRNYIHSITGFKEIIIVEAPMNKGLANSVIAGVTKVINDYGKVIVVEDDIVTHKYFLRFMNEMLDTFENDNRIFSIGGFNYGFNIPKTYCHDIYMVHRAESWGWATWKDRWNKADWNVSDFYEFSSNSDLINQFNRGGNDMFPMLQSQMDGRIDSWAIRWDYCLYKHNAYCIRPKMSFVNNIGFDNSGAHCGPVSDGFTAQYYSKSNYSVNIPKHLLPSKIIARRFKLFQEGIVVNWIWELKHWILSILKHIVKRRNQ